MSSSSTELKQRDMTVSILYYCAVHIKVAENL
jgi:hypothetical protein